MLYVEMSFVADLFEYGDRIEADFRDEELGELERLKFNAFERLHFLDGVFATGEAIVAGMETVCTCAYSDSEGLMSTMTTSCSGGGSRSMEGTSAGVG